GRERSEPGDTLESPAVLRTAPPRHFVPLPQQAGGEIQRGQSDVSPAERQQNGRLHGFSPVGAAAERARTMTAQRTSPPCSGSRTDYALVSPPLERQRNGHGR